MHGWQDNAGTFDRLCPLLPENIPILCIDLPGHGKSSHYPTGMHYFVFWDGIALIRRIVKHFGWKEKITLMGHSLGGALSFMYSAAFPNDVAQFISLDLAGPTVRDHRKTAKITGSCIDKMLSYETLPITKQPCYSYEEMIDLVLDAYGGGIDRKSAEILMRRGMKPIVHPTNGPGFHFSRDLRLKVSLMGMFALDQVISYAEQIRCHVLNVRAVPGMKFEDESVYPLIIETIKKQAIVDYREVPGTHHVHLNAPERISEIISTFLLNPILPNSVAE